MGPKETVLDLTCHVGVEEPLACGQGVRGAVCAWLFPAGVVVSWPGREFVVFTKMPSRQVDTHVMAVGDWGDVVVATRAAGSREWVERCVFSSPLTAPWVFSSSPSASLSSEEEEMWRERERGKDLGELVLESWHRYGGWRLAERLAVGSVPIGRELARFSRWESLGEWGWPARPLYWEGGQRVPDRVEFLYSGGLTAGVVVDAHPTLPVYLAKCNDGYGDMRMLYYVFSQGPGRFVGESAFYVNGTKSMGGLLGPPVWTRLGGRLVARHHSIKWSARWGGGKRRFWSGGLERMERMAMEDWSGELRSIRVEQDRLLLVRRCGGGS